MEYQGEASKLTGKIQLVSEDLSNPTYFTPQLANESFLKRIANTEAACLTNTEQIERALGMVDNLAQSKLSKGKSSFAGNGVAKTIAHGLASTPTAVLITTNENPKGYLGEVWYTADATNLSVFNSGSATTAFTWVAFK